MPGLERKSDTLGTAFAWLCACATVLYVMAGAAALAFLAKAFA